MKKQMFRIAGIAVAIFSAATSFAQVAQSGVTPEKIINLSTSISAAAGDTAVMENLKASNPKLHQSILRKFPNATGVNIYPHKRTTAMYCKVDGIRNNVLFTNKGTWLHTVRYYGIDQLPQDVRTLVEQEFPEYYLLQVAEVNTPSGTAYLVDIEAKKQFKTIRVVGDEWDIYREITKQ